MGSVMRGQIITALKARLSGMGHVLTDSEISILVDDVETAVAANVSAQSDSAADNVGSPDPA